MVGFSDLGVCVALAVVRSLHGLRRPVTEHDAQDFEQELVDQFLLSGVAAGSCDSTVSADRYTLSEFIHFLGRPVWAAQASDADRFLAHQRTLGRARLTVEHKAGSIGRFFGFLAERHQGDIAALIGAVVARRRLDR